MTRVSWLFAFVCLLAASVSSPSLAATDSADAARETKLEILKVTPEGDDVPAGKQIVITFNKPVVPIGKMDRDQSEIPVTIKPEVACQWRWINTSALACNLPDKAQLQWATRYSLDIAPGIKTETGQTIDAPLHREFITQRPAVSYAEFRQWKSPLLPVLRLVFNQPVDKESVAQHVYFAADAPDGKRFALQASPDPQDRELPMILPIPGEKGAVVIDNAQKQKSDDQLQISNGREARRVWLVEPPQELPADSDFVLKSEPGLISALGPEAGIAAADHVKFSSFPAFSFLGVTCDALDGTELAVQPGQDPTVKCDPQKPVRMSFSAPVIREDVLKSLVFNPAIVAPKSDIEGDGEVSEPDQTPDAAAAIAPEFREPHVKGKVYPLWLPVGLKPAQDYSVRLAEGKEIADIFGRKLDKAIEQRFALDHRSPNFVLPYRDAVLEKSTDSEVPVYVNNLKNFSFNYRTVTPGASTDKATVTQPVPDVKDIQFALPLGVRQMLGGKTGAVFGTLHTQPPINDEFPPEIFAQVTPFQVHFKLGHFSSVAWVTDMVSGLPVSGAKVSLYQDALTELHAASEITAEAMTDDQGVAILPGTEKLDPDLQLTSASQSDAKRYFLRVDKGGDMALLPISSEFSINNYRATGSEAVYPQNLERYGHMHVWGATAQGIYRAGDVIQYKIYARDQNTNAFIPPPTKGYRLKIIDPTGKVVGDKKGVVLNEFGAFSGEFTAPKEGAVGWYKFQLIANFATGGSNDEGGDEAAPADDQGNADVNNGDNADGNADGTDNQAQDESAGKKSWIAMRVLVSDFTPAPFKVSNQLNGDLFRAGDQVEVATRAELFSGGAYTDASARITALLDAQTFTSNDPLAKDFTFGSYKGEHASQQIFQKMDSINNKGELNLSFATGTPEVVYGKLIVESAVADDRGKYVTAQSRADFLGVDRLVGLHSNEWLYATGKPADLHYVVVDEHGKPIAGTAVDIKIEHAVTKASRVKGAGNAYLTEYKQEWESAGACQGTSTSEPLVCTFTPAKAGSYRAVASIKDTKGRNHATTFDTYATGSDYVMWDNGSDSSLAVVPQATNYKVGDTARYLVKNPYPGAKALITVERYGVIDHFVQTFDSSTPVVEIKVKPDYLPGFYLSVVVMSPRVEKAPGDGQVDLGKPTYRMGYVSVPVSDPYKDVLVTAKTNQEVYKPRDKVTVSLHAEPRFKDKSEPIELAVVALDESVLALLTSGTNGFDPYKGFYKLESLDLRNYSLLTRLVGRQRFEKKGANPGGDGGKDVSMRSLFKYVGYWNPELKTDAEGNATFTFEAPDNLTGWRILAMAVTPTDRMGLGQGNFKVNRPTEIRPVLPNQVTEGDIFNAGFSVMNRTDKARTIDVSIRASGSLDASKMPAEVKQTVQLDPFKRTTVFIPIATTASSLNAIKGGGLQFEVIAGDAMDKDGLKQELNVNKRQTLEVAANYGTTVQSGVAESIQFPKDMLPNVGSVSVVASPTVIGNMTGAFRYMQYYPYLCWEQRLSKAVMAAHYKELRPYLPVNFKWDGAESLPQLTLDNARSFQAPNGGMVYFDARDDRTDPYLSAYTAIAFNWLRKDGYQVPADVENKLHDYLKNLLKNNAVPSFYSEGMTSTVRAVALAALAQDGKADLADLERYQPHVKGMSLFGKSYFLQAALAIDGGDKYAPAVAKMILATSNETGGKFVFSETWDDSYSRILASPMRENCAVLDAFVAYGETDDGAKLVGDVPFKLVRSITQTRKQRDYWQNTQENLFCGNALIDFARVYENEKPNLTLTAVMDGKPLGNIKFNDVKNPVTTISRPNGATDAGRKTTVQISKKGDGRVYYSTRLTYALPLELTKPQNAGIDIHREYSVERDGKWQLLAAPAEIKRGELVRVDLYLSVPAARNFVVVDDPVPGGLEPVNRDLATTSEVDTRKVTFNAAGGSLWFKYNDWQDFGVSLWNFYHQELRHDSARFYSDYLPAGNYHLSYAAQAIATGTFAAMPTMAQEMYDPDVYGKTESVSLNVAEQAK